MAATTATTNTQALTENRIICRSHCREVGPEPAVVDVPEVLSVDPELLLRVGSFAPDGDVDAVEVRAGWDEPEADIGSTTRS